MVVKPGISLLWRLGPDAINAAQMTTIQSVRRSRYDVVMDASAVRKMRINMQCGKSVPMIIVRCYIQWKTCVYINFFYFHSTFSNKLQI